MRIFMLRQMTRTQKPSATHVTLIRFLPCMRAYVQLKIICAPELLATRIAREILFIRMHLHVTIQIGLTREGLCAYVTHEIFLRMARTLMFLHALLRAKRGITLIAFEIAYAGMS